MKINKDDILDVFNASTYLIWVILKQQWKLLILVLVSSLLIFPAPMLFFSMMEDFRLAMGLIADFAILPSLLLLLVIFPLICSQISSSIIQNRLKTMGMTEWIYNLTFVILFALVATVLFYFMALLSYAFFSNYEFYHYGKLWMLWNGEIVWLALIFIVPISMIGISSVGFLISKWKVHDIIKGVVIFLFIIWLLSMSRVVLSPLDSVWFYEDGTLATGEEAAFKSMKRLDNALLYLNPIGTMVYSIQYSIIGGLISTTSDFQKQGVTPDGVIYLESYIKYTKIWVTVVYSMIWSFGLLALVTLKKWI